MLSDANLEPLDEKCSCTHCNLVGITYGITKKIIDDSFVAVQGSDLVRFRIYGIDEIRNAFASFSPSELEEMFMQLHPNATGKDSPSSESAKKILKRIQNVYYKRGRECPLNEKLIFDGC